MTFEDLCQEKSTWIVKYCSKTYEKPLFLIWYTDTDEDNTDRLLTYKTGEIFGIYALNDVKSILEKEKNRLMRHENLNSWLDGFSNLEPKENACYDVDFIKTSIQNKSLEIPALESFADFVNLYGDFVYQDEGNRHLKIYLDDKRIQKVWSYFYNAVFWARFNDKEKFETLDRPKLRIDLAKLLPKFQDLVGTFEERIKTTPPQ